MLTIDGSFGEGGGQIVRSALAMSLVTGRPCRIHSIRAGRAKPGLMRQHLTAVTAAAKVGDADVEGKALGASQLVFRPRRIVPGDYEFHVGTAGSTSLVLQTILPALMIADAPSTIALEGGTHNPLAPPFDFLELAYLPLLAQIGPRVAATLERHGFYPAGGGRVVYYVQPTRSFHRVEWLRRGELLSREVRALVAGLPCHIAERELRHITDKTGWPEHCLHVVELPRSRGPGNVVMIDLKFENVREVFTAFGERGLRAERVADHALREAQAYLDADAPIGPHLADQLMLPLAVSVFCGGPGGSFRTPRPSGHAVTHAELIRQFLGCRVDLSPQSRDDCVVGVSA